VAESGSAALESGSLAGPPSAFTCPECGGALWELRDGELLRYRCHVGHGYTEKALLAAQTDHLESAMWAALRALEEYAELRRRMAKRAAAGRYPPIARRYEQQANEAEERASLIRRLLTNPDGIAEATAESPAPARQARPRSQKPASKPAPAGRHSRKTQAKRNPREKTSRSRE